MKWLELQVVTGRAQQCQIYSVFRVVKGGTYDDGGGKLKL